MKPKITYGFRGEDIIYSRANRSVELSFTRMHRPRLFTETIAEWEDGSHLTADEKRNVFTEVLHFVVESGGKPVIVINSDDPSRELWEELCSTHAASIEKIEYTSREEQVQFERQTYLEILDAGKKLSVDGVEISSETELDDFLQKRDKGRSS